MKNGVPAIEKKRTQWTTWTKILKPLKRELMNWKRFLKKFIIYCAVCSHVRLFVTPWTVAHQAPPSMEILQARILEWVAMPSSRASSQCRDGTQDSHIADGFFTIWATKVKVAQSYVTLCDPMEYTAHGILQARTLEWVAYPFSNRSSQPRNRTGVSCIAGGFFTSWATTVAEKIKEIKMWKTDRCCLVTKLYPTLCNPMYCSLPGSSIHGISQARILDWVAMSFSRGSSWPRDRTQVSRIAGRCFNLWIVNSDYWWGSRMWKLGHFLLYTPL